MSQLEQQLRDSLRLCDGCKWQSHPQEAVRRCQNARSEHYARECSTVVLCKEREEK